MHTFIQILSLLGSLLGLGLMGFGLLILVEAPFMNVGNGKGFAKQLLLGGVVAVIGMILMSVL